MDQANEPVAFSNSIRLTGREWLFVGAFALLLILFASPVWKRVEKFPLEADYRMPHDLSNDYWLCQRYVEKAVEQYDTFLLGDSVIWGEYVTRQQTLSHYLNEFSGRERFVNLGLDGAHPLALAGLIEHYARAIKGKNVLLQWNPLWLTDPKRDLQDPKMTDFNHPRLLPQFTWRIPAYHEEVSPRIGIAIEQQVPFSSWTGHLQQAYYDRTDIPGWTLEHPYDDPLKPLAKELPPSGNELRHLPQPWFKDRKDKADFPWVNPDSSLQLRAFGRAIEILESRGNKVFVLLGPFNEHMLTAESLETYQRIKHRYTRSLQRSHILHFAPDALPSEEYGDASHPLAAGYARLARQLLAETAFQMTTTEGAAWR